MLGCFCVHLRSKPINFTVHFYEDTSFTAEEELHLSEVLLYVFVCLALNLEVLKDCEFCTVGKAICLRKRI